MIPMLIGARRRQERGDKLCNAVWWAIPLILVSLVVLGVATAVLLGVQVAVPMVAVALVIAGLMVLLALVVLLVALLRQRTEQA